MATSIGPRIGVDGYNEFKTQMDTITSKLRTLELEAAKLEKQYEGQTDSLEYLTQKQELYNKQLELQQQRLEAAAKWQEKVAAHVSEKAQATDRDNLAVAKAEELTAKYNVELQKTENVLQTTKDQVKDYGKNLVDAATAAEDMRDRTETAAVAIGNLISRLIEKAAQLGKQMIETGVNFNATMESYQASYSTLLGSQAEAAKALSGIMETANKAPTFSIGALADANRSLLATGLNAEDANKKIVELATALAAAGQGDDALRRMATNLQQIANNGQAFAIDIRQFNNVGIPVWNLLADYTGKTKEELAGTTITFEMLTGAFEQAASAGGRFYGALDAQAQTFNGQINALKNNVTKGLGSAFEGLTKTLESSVLPALNNFFSSPDSVKGLVAAAEGAATAIALIGVKAKASEWMATSSFDNAAQKVLKYKAALDAGHISQAQFTASMGGSDIAVGLFTGELTVAEAATWALNTAMAALPFAVVAAGVGLLVTGIKNYKNSVDNVKSENIIDTDNIDEATAHLEELQARIKELEGIWPEFRTREQQIEIDALNGAIKETKAQIEALTAEEAAAAEASKQPENQLKSVVQTAKDTLTELYAAYDEAYTKAYEAAQKEFDLFEYIEGVSYTSVQEMMKALDSQTLYWENYATNLAIVRDVNYGLSQDLIAFLSDGSAESAGYLQSIINDVDAAGGYTSEAGQQIIRDINTSFADLQKAQSDYADEAAITATGLEKEVSKTVDEMIASLKELEITDEMKESAIADMQAFSSGLSSQSDLLTAQSYIIGRDIAFSLQSGINSVQVSLPTFGGNYARNTYFNPKGYATGLDYVPYDEFPAYLHKGEMVLTAADAAKYRSGNVTTNNSRTTNFGGIAINVFAAEDQSVDEIADAVAYKLQAAVEGRERAG